MIDLLSKEVKLLYLITPWVIPYFQTWRSFYFNSIPLFADKDSSAFTSWTLNSFLTVHPNLGLRGHVAPILQIKQLSFRLCLTVLADHNFQSSSSLVARDLAVGNPPHEAAPGSIINIFKIVQCLSLESRFDGKPQMDIRGAP